MPSLFESLKDAGQIWYTELSFHQARLVEFPGAMVGITSEDGNGNVEGDMRYV